MEPRVVDKDATSSPSLFSFSMHLNVFPLPNRVAPFDSFKIASSSATAGAPENEFDAQFNERRRGEIAEARQRHGAQGNHAAAAAATSVSVKNRFVRGGSRYVPIPPHPHCSILRYVRNLRQSLLLLATHVEVVMGWGICNPVNRCIPLLRI